MEQVTIGIGAILTIMVTIQIWIINGLRGEIRGLRIDMKGLMPRTECAVHHIGHAAEHKAKEEANEKDKNRLEQNINGFGGRVTAVESAVYALKNK